MKTLPCLRVLDAGRAGPRIVTGIFTLADKRVSARVIWETQGAAAEHAHASPGRGSLRRAWSEALGQVRNRSDAR